VTEPFTKLSEKDNFHNLILGIDKRPTSGIVNSTNLTNFSLSKGGDGLRKALKPIQPKLQSPVSNLAMDLHLTSHRFKGHQRKVLSQI